jgi:putative MATE family efflux protein
MNSRKHLGSAVFYKMAISLAVPVMLQALLQSMVSLIDNFMVAGLGDVKMSGVNIVNQFVFVLFVALNTIMSAGGMFMSQFNGAKNEEGMRQTFKFKFHASFALSVAAIAVGIAFPRQILSLLVNVNVDAAAIVDEGSKYLALILFTFIPIAISTCIGSSLRETGKVRPPLVISVVATLVNTFFNWVFIYGNLGAPRLEVEGAAIATIIARLAELAAYLVYVRMTKPAFAVRIRTLYRVNLELFRTILRKNGVIFLTEMSWVVTETVMTAVYNGRGGADIVSGMAAGWAIANIFMLVFGGIHTSIGVIVGGTLGRGDLDLAREQARWLRTGAFIMGLAVALVEVFSVALVPLVFGNLSPNAQRVTRELIWVISFYMPFWAYLNSQFATARSGGDAVMGMWVDLAVNMLLFLPGIFLLANLTPLGPIGIYGIVKITDFAKVALAAWQIRTERWLKNLAKEHGEGLLA